MSSEGEGTARAPSDEAVEAAAGHVCCARPPCAGCAAQTQDIVDAAYAIDMPRVRAEERARYDEFIEGLTAKLNAAGVPAMPSWPDAIDWLIERAESARAEALREAQKALRDKYGWNGHPAPADFIAAYFNLEET